MVVHISIYIASSSESSLCADKQKTKMVRKQEKLQSLGFFGIIKESIRIIYSRPKIFTHITLALILPHSFILLSIIKISKLLIFSNTLIFWLFRIPYLTFFFTLYLLSTAAVVYTIACFYTSKYISFNKVITVVPRLWNRLLLTSLPLAFLNNIPFWIPSSWARFLFTSKTGIMIFLGIIIVIWVVLVYLSVVCPLAGVVSVLEDECYGLKAMNKSRKLIKGKMGVAVAMFFFFSFCIQEIESAFDKFVVAIEWSPASLATSILFAILCCMLLSGVMLLELVVRTIIYFVCKSCHHDNIHKSSLSDRLEDYVPLKTMDVHLQLSSGV